MMNIRISDSNQLIKFACEDLQAVQTVIMTIEDDQVLNNSHEALIVVRRALDPIIKDLKEATQTIDEELENCD